MRYNVIQFVTNTSNGYGASVVSTHDNINSAKVKYHQLLAALHNANDVKMASVKIENEYGNNCEGYFEIVNHITEETATEE